MSDFQFGQRQQDAEDVAAIIAILQENNEALTRITKTSHMSHRRIITLAIQHFGSLSLKEQLKLVEQYLVKKPVIGRQSSVNDKKAIGS